MVVFPCISIIPNTNKTHTTPALHLGLSPIWTKKNDVLHWTIKSALPALTKRSFSEWRLVEQQPKEKAMKHEQKPKPVGAKLAMLFFVTLLPRRKSGEIRFHLSLSTQIYLIIAIYTKLLL